MKWARLVMMWEVVPGSSRAARWGVCRVDMSNDAQDSSRQWLCSITELAVSVVATGVVVTIAVFVLGLDLL